MDITSALLYISYRLANQWLWLVTTSVPSLEYVLPFPYFVSLRRMDIAIWKISNDSKMMDEPLPQEFTAFEPT